MTGNMGQLFSKTKEELDRLTTEEHRNVEVWKSASMMNKAKNRVFEEQGMLIQTDKIAKLIESRQSKLSDLKHNQSSETLPASTHDGGDDERIVVN